MSVLFGLGFGLLWLRERLNRAQLLGAAICIVGVAIITFQPGDYFRLGSLLVVGSAFLYALHAALGEAGRRKARRQYDWNITAPRFREVLASLAQGGPK
jgi:drug/metabolite transporter (DMT)-like permease